MSIKRKLVAAVIGAALFCGTATVADASTAVRSAVIAETVESGARTLGQGTVLYTGAAVEIDSDTDFVTFDASCTVTAPLAFTWVDAWCTVVDLATGSRWFLDGVVPRLVGATYEASGTFTGLASRDYMLCIQGEDYIRLYDERCALIDHSKL